MHVSVICMQLGRQCGRNGRSGTMFWCKCHNTHLLCVVIKRRNLSHQKWCSWMDTQWITLSLPVVSRPFLLVHWLKEDVSVNSLLILTSQNIYFIHETWYIEINWIKFWGINCKFMHVILVPGFHVSSFRCNIENARIIFKFVVFRFCVTSCFAYFELSLLCLMLWVCSLLQEQAKSLWYWVRSGGVWKIWSNKLVCDREQARRKEEGMTDFQFCEMSWNLNYELSSELRVLKTAVLIECSTVPQ